MIVNYFSRIMDNIKQILPHDDDFLQRTTVIDKPAKKLWYIGNIPPLTPTVAVVGSRKPTGYGRAVNARITGELARHGVVIVSGLAIGHDGLAHRACLDAGGTTVAVLGNGLAHIYPQTNRTLARRIVQAGGALISEYPPEAPVLPHQFLERNRLISALADVVVVIEAGERSGTLNTASHALTQGKEVMAVPGNITSPLSTGCNRLIAQGAGPVLTAQDVLDRLPLAKTEDRPDHQAERADQVRFDSPDSQTIYDLIVQGESDGDRLLSKSGLSTSQFSLALTMLELNGYIVALGNNTWCKR